MNKTIQYEHKNKIYKINISNPYTERLHVSVNDIVCGCYSSDNFIKEPDFCLGVAIRRYGIEKKLGLI